MINFCPIRCDEAAYSDYTDIFAKCFPAAKHYSRDYLDWLYRCNPDGQVVGFDARDGDRLAAHYACIPGRAKVGGEEVKVLLSLNTATHPDYQGKGLFTQLAEHTYTAASALGYDCVYGVANANSTPGFIRKLGFQLVSPLRAMAGIGAVGIDFRHFDTLEFRRSWSSSSIAWRCASPVRPIICRKTHDRTILVAPALFDGFFKALAEIDQIFAPDVEPSPSNRFESPLRLFIGMAPRKAISTGFYINIPHALRPSPLNFIYRSLSGRVMSIDPDSVFFTFLDFDAY